jgi:diguanylate cyclase (GGDEF)-like protein
MKPRKSSVPRLVIGNLWTFVCVGSVASGVGLALRVGLGSVAPGLRGPGIRIGVSLGAVFGTLAGIYGLISTIRTARQDARLRRTEEELGVLRKRNRLLESRYTDHRKRLDELATLREIATLVNQESDFTIIAEKALELVYGLLEPLNLTLFIEEAHGNKLQPFAAYHDGKAYTGRKVTARGIPDFDVAVFERHSMVYRLRGQEMHAIVPLRIEDRTHGVLFLVFPADARTANQQTEEFHDRRRPVLLEIAHHLSLAVKAKYLQTKAVVDALTQLYTRSHYDAQIQSAVELSRRTWEPFSLILLDIDRFKLVNDTFGHATGDIILRRVARRIKDALRKYDTAYRYGGEEMVALLPRTHIREATRIAERLRRRVGGSKFRGADNTLVSVTVSLGVAQFQAGDTPATVFERADQRLYDAKSEGRNRVVPAASTR